MKKLTICTLLLTFVLGVAATSSAQIYNDKAPKVSAPPTAEQQKKLANKQAKRAAKDQKKREKALRKAQKKAAKNYKKNHGQS